MGKISPVIWTFIVILLMGAVIVGAMKMGYIKGDYFNTGVGNTVDTTQTYSPVQQGGSRFKKYKNMIKNPQIVGTRGIYLLLGGVLVGYIISRFS